MPPTSRDLIRWGRSIKIETKTIAAWESGRGVEEGDRSEESGPICRGGWKGEFECVTRGSPQLLLPFEPGQSKRLGSRSSTSKYETYHSVLTDASARGLVIGSCP